MVSIGEVSPAPRTFSTHSGDIDAAGLVVLSGFVDMHVHGGGGADFMRGTPEAVRQVARTHARFGTTGLLATTLTASRESTLTEAIISARNVMEAGPGENEARILRPSSGRAVYLPRQARGAAVGVGTTAGRDRTGALDHPVRADHSADHDCPGNGGRGRSHSTGAEERHRSLSGPH